MFSRCIATRSLTLRLPINGGTDPSPSWRPPPWSCPWRFLRARSRWPTCCRNESWRRAPAYWQPSRLGFKFPGLDGPHLLPHGVPAGAVAGMREERVHAHLGLGLVIEDVEPAILEGRRVVEGHSAESIRAGGVAQPVLDPRVVREVDAGRRDYRHEGDDPQDGGEARHGCLRADRSSARHHAVLRLSRPPLSMRPQVTASGSGKDSVASRLIMFATAKTATTMTKSGKSARQFYRKPEAA